MTVSTGCMIFLPVSWFLGNHTFLQINQMHIDCKTVRILRIRVRRAVKQKVWNEAENRERDWGETLRACEARAVRAHKTLTPRVTDFFTDFEEKTDCFAV